MGNCIGKTTDADERNTEINIQLKKDKKRHLQDVKLLLLGAGESGKSTILKQMRMIHSNGFTDEERFEYRTVVYQNTIESMQSVLSSMDPSHLNIPLQKSSNESYKQLVVDTVPPVSGAIMAKNVGEALVALWQDKGVRKCMERSSAFQLLDSAP